MDRPSRWIYLLPSLHLCACLTSYVGLLIPSLQHLGMLFTFVLLADLPISLPAYFLGWKYSTFAAIWIFLPGTLWWYLLGRGAQALLSRFTRQNDPETRLTSKVDM
jgi:hypothetical protein